MAENRMGGLDRDSKLLCDTLDCDLLKIVRLNRLALSYREFCEMETTEIAFVNLDLNSLRVGCKGESFIRTFILVQLLQRSERCSQTGIFSPMEVDYAASNYVA